MYCRNCGVKLDDTSKYCSECGTTVDGAAEKRTVNIPAADFGRLLKSNKMIASNRIYSIISVIAAGVMAFMLLQKWFEIPLLTSIAGYLSDYVKIPSEFAIFDFLKYITKLPKLGLDDKAFGIAVIFAIINIVMWIRALYLLIKYIYFMVKGEKRDTGVLREASTVILILAGIDFIAMLIINANTDDLMEYIGADSVSLKTVVYILAAISIAVRILLIPKVDNELYENNRDTPSNTI